MRPSKSRSCFAIPLWWLPLREVPLVSPKESHCDSEGFPAVGDADSMGLWRETCESDVFRANPRRFNGVGSIPTSFYGRRIAGNCLVRRVSRPSRRIFQESNPLQNHEDLCRYEIATGQCERPCEIERKPVEAHRMRLRSSMGYNNL